jgi:hypothetical protein
MLQIISVPASSSLFSVTISNATIKLIDSNLYHLVPEYASTQYYSESKLPVTSNYMLLLTHTHSASPILRRFARFRC